MSVDLERLKRSLLGRLLWSYFDSQTPNYAAGLAFNAFLTMFPIILGLVAILGLFLSDAGFKHDVVVVLVGIFPLDAKGANEIEATLNATTKHESTLLLVSVVALVWSGTGLFGSLEFALNHIYGVAGRNPLRQRVVGLRLIVVFVVAVVAAVALNSLVAFVDADPAVLNVAAGWLVCTYLLAWIYRYVPNLRLTFREVLPGAVMAGGLVEVLTLIFPLAWHTTHRASLYTKGFALFFLLATWLYLLSQLLLMGAVLNRLLRPVTPVSALGLGVPAKSADFVGSGDVPALKEAAAVAVVQEAQPGGV